MPFYYDGECAKHLKELGFERVIHTNEDFFEKIKDKQFMRTVDVIWDNPPYTSQETKQKLLEGLKSTGKPFCMLLPLPVVHAQFVRDILDMTKVQCIIPRKVRVCKTNKDPVPFKYLVWLCYKCNLNKDLYFI